jgi:hypothetical protein
MRSLQAVVCAVVGQLVEIFSPSTANTEPELAISRAHLRAGRPGVDFVRSLPCTSDSDFLGGGVDLSR